MAVYRPIQISFWQKKFVLKLTPEQKYFYIYLLTNSKTSQCGIYELPIKIIETETGYNTETVTKLLEVFIQAQKIKYDYENEEIFIMNWLKYNQINNGNVAKCVIGEIKEIKNESFKKDFQRVLDKLNNNTGFNLEIKGACKGLRSKQTETETEEQTETKDFDFEVIWKEYPNAVGRKQALKHFSTSVKSQADYNNIKLALENYKKSERVLKGFIQNGSTWFNNWQDWIPKPEIKKKPLTRADVDALFGEVAE